MQSQPPLDTTYMHDSKPSFVTTQTSKLNMSKSLLLLFLLVFVLLYHASSEEERSNKFIGSIGAILDLSSHESKVQRVVMEVGVHHYEVSTGNRLLFQVLDSQGDPTQAATAAINLINKQRVMAIFGVQTWPEAIAVANIAAKAQVPILSLAKSNPLWASQHWPYLLQLNRDLHTQLRAISSVVNSWRWRRVTVIYEDLDYTGTNVIPRLVDSLREFGSEVDFQVPLSPFSSVSDELEVLKGRPCRIFIVHASVSLTARLFKAATDMGMMEKDYGWIITAETGNLIDSVNQSVIGSMQGGVGIKSYFAQGSESYKDLYNKFHVTFSLRYPKEFVPQLDIFDVVIYDIVLATALAIEKTGTEGKSLFIEPPGDYRTDKENVLNYTGGPRVLALINQSNFDGLSGRIQFQKGELVAEQIFQVINVVGRSYREMGFWTDELGFSKSINSGANYSSSMRELGQVYWPGGSWHVPTGWASPTSSKPLRIGVPAISAFPDYVNAKRDTMNNKTVISGFSIDIFKAAIEYLPYKLDYELVAYYGTYDSLIMEKVPLKVFDAVVGDTAILSYRCEFAEFTQPYTQSGYVLVVPLQKDGTSQAWIFTRPFTGTMWISIFFLCMINIIGIWSIERNVIIQNAQAQGLKIGPLIWVCVATLFSNGERLRHDTTRFVLLMWMFVGLVLTSSYTASLSSMLTVQKLKPASLDIYSLKKSNATIGCNTGGSIVGFLEDVLGFHPHNIKQIQKGDDYPEAFEKGEIQAAIFASGHAKMFLAKYCKSYAAVEPTFHAGGFGFVFPKNSHLLPDMSQAILKLFESGKMQSMENGMLISHNCSSTSQFDLGDGRLSPSSFLGLFGLMFGTLVFALLISHSGSIYQWFKSKIATTKENVHPQIGNVQPEPIQPNQDQNDVVYRDVHDEPHQTRPTSDGPPEHNQSN